MGQEWVLGSSRTTLPKCCALVRRKTLCMSQLQSPSVHRLQDRGSYLWIGGFSFELKDLLSTYSTPLAIAP